MVAPEHHIKEHIIGNYMPSFFFLVNVARDLLNLLIFSKNQILVSVIFSVFLFSVPLISILIFIISFLLLSLSLNCSSFSHCLRWNLRLLILDLPSFLIYTFNAKHSKCCFHCILQVLVDCIFIFIEFKILFNYFNRFLLKYFYFI